ncbi:MAG: hypothetical protein PUJ93_07525 [Oscillospiraceae bacterium]|nr:hypothetical protein [Oscillospiraceae bacterium]MDY5736143.1 hypothetical protein [Oscillospiraceae bacterium]
MQVGILDRKNERTPSFLFIMTENKLRRRTGKSTKRHLHPGKTEYLFIKNEEITGKTGRERGGGRFFAKNPAKWLA